MSKADKDDGTTGYYQPRSALHERRDYWLYMLGTREPYRQRAGAIFWRFGVQLIIAALVIAIPVFGLLVLLWCVWCLVRGLRLLATQRRLRTARRSVSIRIRPEVHGARAEFERAAGQLERAPWETM